MSDKKSYGQILKSSSIMGGVGAITMVLGIVRTKFAAILIGTVGVGITSNFLAIQGLVSTVTGLGLRTSAVRDVASAVAKNDDHAIAQTVITLRRLCWITGLFGAVMMAVASPLLSQWTFGSSEYTLDIAAIGIVILFMNLSNGQMAFIQGQRRISDMAQAQLIGAIAATVITISCYLWLGLRGIVPALVLASAVQLIASWWYAKRSPLLDVKVSWKESILISSSMVRLGLAMMWSGLLGSTVIYVTNSLITNQISVEAVGIYSAAFVLSAMFVNLALSSMAADYYPQLSGMSGDKEAMNKLVNEQTEIGLLLSVPGLIATLGLAPWLIQLFYSSDFMQAIGLLQWFILGCLLRVVSWPLGFVMLALQKGRWFVFTETTFNIIHLLLIGWGIMTLGVEGVSVAFFVMYIGYAAAVYAVAHHLIGFRWSLTCRKLLIILFPLVGLTFIAVRLLPLWWATFFGVTATVVVSILCLRSLVNRIGLEHRLSRLVLRLPVVRTVCGL